MGRATVILSDEAEREKALGYVQKAPLGTRVEFKRSKRSIPQNDRMWAMLTDISEQHLHHNVRLSPDDWKLVFLAALNTEMRMVPNIEGTGFVNLGRSSSKLTKEEMSDLMELIAMFAAQHGVTLHDKEAA